MGVMRGPAPKDPSLRQRRNKASTRATLHVAETWKRAPSLPKRTDGQDWHSLTKAFWHDIWHSPMAKEYLRADVHGLYRVAMLVDRFWKAPNMSLEAQINRSGSEYGISPLSRRRLEWIVERIGADKKTKPQHVTTTIAGDDPRKYLQVIS